MLVSLMMQMRQKNLMVIIVLPTFFQLEKYVAIFRTRSLIHVYESKGQRGYFQVLDRHNKRFLYLTGSKTYDYSRVRTDFRGRFRGVFALGEDLEQAYRDKKEKALAETQEADKPETGLKTRARIAIANLFILRNKFDKITQIDFCKELQAVGLPVTNGALSKMLIKTRENRELLEIPQ